MANKNRKFPRLDRPFGSFNLAGRDALDNDVDLEFKLVYGYH